MENIKIKYFRVVYELGSIRRASEILHITPGALSKSIKLLEQNLGDILFIPQGRNIVPSDFGKRIYSITQNLVDAYDKFNQELSVVETQSQFVIATWEVFSSYFCSFFAISTSDEFLLKVLERIPNDIENDVVAGVADVGITYAPIPHPDLEFIKVGHIQYGIFATKNNFSKLKINEIPFAVPISVFPQSPTGVRTLDNWPSAVDRNEAFQFELLETALEVARQGGAAIFCPSFLIKMQNKKLKPNHQLYLVDGVSIPKVKKNVYLVKRKSQPENDMFKLLMTSLKGVLKA
jgi:DNA-binding transcriptional LysR family regulator